MNEMYHALSFFCHSFQVGSISVPFFYDLCKFIMQFIHSQVTTKFPLSQVQLYGYTQRDTRTGTVSPAMCPDDTVTSVDCVVFQ